MAVFSFADVRNFSKGGIVNFIWFDQRRLSRGKQGGPERMSERSFLKSLKGQI